VFLTLTGRPRRSAHQAGIVATQVTDVRADRLANHFIGGGSPGRPKLRGFKPAWNQVTQEIAFARDIADHVLFMDAGRIAEHGPADEIPVRPANPRTRPFSAAFITRGRCDPPA
jgi:hypothetical protein